MKTMTAMRLGTIFIVLLTASCTKTPEELIVGNWQGPEGTGSIEFYQDGGVTVRIPEEKAPVPGIDSISGNWTILEDGKLKMDLSLMGESTTQIGTINFPDQNKLDITNEKGVVDPFTRIASPSDSISPKASASTSVVGVYGGKSCVYQKLEFKEGGKLYISVAGMEIPAEYEVDGNKVLFSDGQGRGIVFTKEGNALFGGIAGICTKL